jgi:uncharacterized protein (TIGR00369 family)
MSSTHHQQDLQWKAKNPDYERAVRETFARQTAMALIGATLEVAEPGFIEIRLPNRPDIRQQHGVVHGGVVGMVVDSACAFTAVTVLPPNMTGFSVEYKINFLAPASGELVVARAWVLRTGRSLTVARGEAYAVTNGSEQLVAAAMETILHFPAGDS